MYFKASCRRNPQTEKVESYYRLVESYRDANNYIRHRTIVTAGFIDHFTAEELNFIQKNISDRINGKPILMVQDSDTHLLEYADELYRKALKDKKIDSKIDPNKNMVHVDLNTLEHPEAKEFGAEWLGFQALKQLKIDSFLMEQKWTDEKIQLAMTQIISRAVFPASENKTSKWIGENSSICELTGYPIQKITKDKLYQSALDLYVVKDDLEQFLSKKTDELFDIQDTIYLYDLTNTYFEGQKRNSDLAQFGRSKEKRSDAKLVVLAVVVNLEGFLKYSNIYQGNMADCKTLSDMIDNLKVGSGLSNQKSLIVFDAGIATQENLDMVVAKGYDYVCVNRTKLVNYDLKTEIPTIIYDSKNQKITLNQIELNPKKETKKQETIEHDFCMYKVKSDFKAMKERSMNVKFKERFELELEKLAKGITLKSGIKTQEKVQQKIGRLKEKYPSIAPNFTVTCTLDQIKVNVIKIEWLANENAVKKEKEQGIYFLKTSLKDKDEATIWKIYNALREVESTFRTLKTDLDLRPIYHKNDNATMAHLHLGLLGYWIVNTIRHQLKTKKINHNWKEILRIATTQKLVTTSMVDNQENTIYITKCSEPSPKLQEIHQALKYKSRPFRMKKFVVPKPEHIKHQVEKNRHLTG
jgi:predicted SprT family Zn-dependent metalloprotease